jgi:hypothetical protein
MRILYVADAAPINLIAEGLMRGLRANGHEVLTYGPGLEVFFGFEVPIRNALDLLNWKSPRFYPDLVWYSDSKFYAQWDGMDCPRVFTWVDPNCFDGVARAREADAVFLFKKQYLPAVHGLNENTEWVPYGVDESVYHPDTTAPKLHRVVCAGTLDDERRSVWMPLKQRLGDDLLMVNEVWGEDLAQLYRQAEIVLDWHRSNVWGDRTLMALACGACNLTNVVPGLLDVFCGGEHLVVYDPASLCDVVSAVLADHDLRARIAAGGCKEVLYRHTWRQRATDMIAFLRERKVLPDAVKLPSLSLRSC